MANRVHEIENIAIGAYLSLFYRQGVSYLTSRFEPYHIGYGQIQFLVQLYLQDGLSNHDLTKIVRVDKATTTRALSKLYDQGDLEVKQDDMDKRKYQFYVTKQALAIKDEVIEIVTAWEQEMLSALTKEEQEVFQALCNKIAVKNEWS